MKKPIPFGKYDLLERINVGGMAEVFCAKAYGVEGFERLVAVKRILPNIAEDHEFITMFVDEAKIAVQLNHANIAQIFDLGVVDGAYFIALEYVHGRDLRLIFERCRLANAPMPVAQACFIVMKMCEGLDYAHNKRDAQGREMNLVHRDVSPQNVLVSFEGEIKIIDFGIAKAAGKAGKTQQGILKGKFGYMSPEQVRGLPIDRRSDVFSAGIVLYELLTDERLFVGESDFSTLEKVRNVEILPPSTYNRKIPDELERIVLKALAKDVEDRYPNAIDLHDELQAFVYTAGEFYSRKDLAAWMKKTFAREIEEEAAKIEQYRQVPSRGAPRIERPVDRTIDDGDTIAERSTLRDEPSPTPSPVPSAAKVTRPARKATLAMPAAVPPPAAKQAIEPAPPPGNGRSRRPTQPPPMPPAAVAPGRPPAVIVQPSPPPMAAAAPPAAPPARGDLEWDDEELETQIYESTPGQAAPAGPGVGPQSSAARRERPAQPAFIAAPTPTPDEAMPAMGAPRAEPPPSSPEISAQRRGRRSHAPGAGERREQSARRTARPAANGAPAFLGAREPAVTARGTIVPEINIRRPPSPAKLWLTVALGAVLLAALIAGGTWVFSSSAPEPAPVATSAPATAPETAPAPLPIDPNTGFELRTEPPGGKVRLDGAEIGISPLRVTSLLAGKHALEIGGVAGYRSLSQEIDVEQGKTLSLALTLEKETVAPGPTVVKLTSEPPGAKVTLVGGGARTALGVTPTEAKIDGGKPYEAVFELDGYAPVTRQIGGGDTAVAAVLVRAGATPSVAAASPPATVASAAAAPAPKKISAPSPRREKAARAESAKRARERAAERQRRAERPRPVAAITPPVVSSPRETSPGRPIETTPQTTREPIVTGPASGPRTVEVSTGTGKLVLGAKPPCSVIIDGVDTGRTTPVRDLEVKSGPVKVTLVNTEFGIRESFTVTVKPGETSKVIKDYTDRIPQQ